MKPLSYSKWLESKEASRQRRSPQWQSFRQRANYYKLYVFSWMDANATEDDLGLIFQAIYSPYVADLIPTRSFLLDVARHDDIWDGTSTFKLPE